MKIKTLVPHTYDGKSYLEGDEYEVADETIAETIVANGMGAAVVAAPAAAPPPVDNTPPTPSNHHTRKHKS